MKITRLAFVSLLGVSLVVGLACGQQQTSENTGSFEIYLAVNLSVYTYPDYYVNCSDVDNIALLGEPIVSTEDIISYNWSDHCIQLTEDGCHHVSAALGQIDSLVSPFVVVADGERIYIGAFVSMFSSYWPSYPSIWYFGKEDWCNSSRSLTIGSGFCVSNESDVRSDYRIYQALKQAGKLIE